MTKARPTGYSGKPVITKLGYKAGEKVYVLGAPDEFVAHLIEHSITLVDSLPADWVHVFVSHQSELENILKSLDRDQIDKGLWVSWPKKSSKTPSDLTEQKLRDVILPLKWVDTKVAAIDETWSGLKFHRQKNRFNY